MADASNLPDGEPRNMRMFPTKGHAGGPSNLSTISRTRLLWNLILMATTIATNSASSSKNMVSLWSVASKMDRAELDYGGLKYRNRVGHFTPRL